MARQRRTSYYLVATDAQGREGRTVKVLAYSEDGARALLESHGYTNVRRQPPAAATINGIHKDRVRALARSWGIEWPVEVRVQRARAHHGVCRTSYAERIHRLTIDPTGDHIERTIRHELGHALDNEQGLDRFNGDARALVAAEKRDKRARGYYNSRAERAARAQENRDLHIRLTY